MFKNNDLFALIKLPIDFVTSKIGCYLSEKALSGGFDFNCTALTFDRGV